MIPFLLQRMIDGTGGPQLSRDQAVTAVLTADPLDLNLHFEQLWALAKPWQSPSATLPLPGSARAQLTQMGRFASYIPTDLPAWDHLGYSYVLENTRAIQILRRVVQQFRAGEGLGTASPYTQQWLDATEAILFGAANPFPAWLSTSTIRSDPEAVRRNAYWRMFGLDLAFGDDHNQAPVYDKASASNGAFIRLFEELLSELWRAMINERNIAGENAADDDRIFRITEELAYIIRSRRLDGALAREEAVAAMALGWAELTVSDNNQVVKDLGAEATSQATRLQLIGEKVGLAAHSKSAAFFSMAASFSKFLYTIESGIVNSAGQAWVLYLEKKPDPNKPGEPIGKDSRRVITEWAAATGKDLKVRSKPVAVQQQTRLAAVR